MSSKFTRTVAALTFVAALGGSVAACGAGQVSQSADQAAAVNGSTKHLGPLSLADVKFVFPTGQTEFSNDKPLELAFVISNAGTTPDQLLSITGPDGKATISGSTTINPAQALRAGNPAGLLSVSPAPNEQRIAVTIASTSVTPGLTEKLTFAFKNAGSVDVDTPVDAGDLERQDQPRGATEAEH